MAIPEHGWFIYVLMAGDDVLYVGQSKNLRIRLKHHMVRHPEWDRFALFPVSEALLDAFEQSIIRAASPKYNRVGAAGFSDPEQIRGSW
jgi:excinuclease UvrABC nuclease subunit